METSLATTVGPIRLERPVMLASGILGISLDVFNRLYRSGAGAVVTKSLSKEPWEGRNHCRSRSNRNRPEDSTKRTAGTGREAAGSRRSHPGRGRWQEETDRDTRGTA